MERERSPDARRAGDKIYTERIKKPAQMGATLTVGDYTDALDEGLRLLFTAGGESPTLPVTREEYLRAQIFQTEGALRKKSMYQEWMEQAPARQKGREEVATIMAASDPAKAAQFRRDMEKAEREQTERLKAAEVQSTGRPADPIRAKIAAMTPAERAMPTFVAGSDFVPASSPNAHAIVRENPAFYRARRSPVEPRAVIVLFPNHTHKELEAERQQMFREFDFAALKRLVAPQP